MKNNASKNISLSTKLRQTFAMSLAGGLLATLIGLRYLKWIELDNISTASFTALVFSSHFFILTLLLSLPFYILCLLPRKQHYWFTLGIVTLGLFTLLVDSFVYDQFRFHLSGFVLELAYGAGLDLFGLSKSLWALMVVIFLILGLMTHYTARFFNNRRTWIFIVFISICITAQLVAQIWHIWADAHSYKNITTIGRHLPLFSGATGKRLLTQWGLIDPQKLRKSLELRLQSPEYDNGSQLNYPLQPLQCTAPLNLYNILVIAVDTLRHDMIHPKWMPHVNEFAKKSQTFTNHFSNGNITKAGIFTLLYGLPASYWNAFTAEKKPPVLMTRMRELNYKMKVLSSASLVSPAFDKNVFSNIKKLRLKTKGTISWERDQNITQDWLNFIDQHDFSQPFFGFLFYDSPHDPYVPEGYPRFEPFWENPNHIYLHNDFDPEEYFNNYKTTVHFTDSLLNEVLMDLKKRQLLDKTIVVITSDHGQEFNENKQNYWGHGSNFTDIQVRVPMIIHWPQKPVATYEYKTQHFDFAPTFMQQALGCEKTPLQNYSTGNSLFDDTTRLWSLVHSHNGFGLLYEDMILTQNAVGPLEVTDKNLRPVPSQKIPKPIVLEVFKSLSRFYK